MMSPTSPTLTLTFSGVGGFQRRATVTARYGGVEGPERAVEDPLTEAVWEDVHWYVEDFLSLPEGGNLIRARGAEQKLDALGDMLGTLLLGGEVERAWRDDVLQAGGGRLELAAATPGDEIIFRTPWELMHIGEGGAPLHALGVSLVRRVSSPSAHNPLQDARRGLRILAIVCRPRGTPFLEPRYTPAAILSALE